MSTASELPAVDEGTAPGRVEARETTHLEVRIVLTRLWVDDPEAARRLEAKPRVVPGVPQHQDHGPHGIFGSPDQLADEGRSDALPLAARDDRQRRQGDSLARTEAATSGDCVTDDVAPVGGEQVQLRWRGAQPPCGPHDLDFLGAVM